MKSSYYLIFMMSIFGAQAFADAESVISVKGFAKLYIPINRVSLRISTNIEGPNAQVVEENGYQKGITLKKLFQKYGIIEKAILDSGIEFYKGTKFVGKGKEKVKQDNFTFLINYIVLFDRVELLDDFRKECIASGIEKFQLSEVMNSERSSYEAKLKKMAYRNAQEKAELVIEGSGLKLGMPTSINTGYSRDYSNDDSSSYSSGLAADPNIEKRENLFHQKQFYITDEINVSFKIEELN